MLNSRIELSSSNTGNINTDITYQFRYSGSILPGDFIVLNLPKWGGNYTTTSTCTDGSGTTQWTATSSVNSTLAVVNLQASADTLNAATTCTVLLTGATNPSAKIQANLSTITNAVGGSNPDVTKSHSIRLELVAKLHEDSISLSKAFTGASDGNLTYTFKYGADIAVGNQITLTLPNWVNSTAISSSSTCGTGSTSWLLSTANSGSTYSVTLQAAPPLSANASCSVVIQGLTNPSVKLPANMQV